MALIQLLLFDDDEEYSLNLCNYLTHYYSEILMVNYCSNAFNIKEWIDKIDPDIILTCEKYYIQIENNFNKIIIILTGGRNSTTTKDALSIYKYKDVNQIAGDIINLFTQAGNIIRTVKEKTPKIVTVYSASGNVGKTSVALGISNKCSYSGLSVVYLNFEQFQSTSILFSSSSEYSISDIIYYAKERDRNLLSAIPIMCCKDIASNVHYFKEPNNVFEINELLPKDIEFIIDTMKECGQFDLIVIDMDSQLNENTMKLFEAADEILYIITDDKICLHKTKLFLDNINLLSNQNDKNTFLAHKFKFIANKVSKQALQSQKAYLELNVISHIPFEQRLLSMSDPAALNGGPELINNAFNEIAKRYIT